jgi:hypothetical protein
VLANSLCVSIGEAKDRADGRSEAIPTSSFGFQSFAAFCRKPVELGFAASVGCFPIGGEEFTVFEAVQRGVERTFRRLNDASGDLFQALRNCVAVDWTKGDDFEEKKIESALGKIGFG